MWKAHPRVKQETLKQMSVFGMKKLSAGRADKQKSYTTRQDMGRVMKQ